MPKKLMKVTDLANMWGLTPWSVRCFVKKHNITCYQLNNRQYHVDAASFESHMQTRLINNLSKETNTEV